MVIYGSVGVDKDGEKVSAKCLHGGAKFIIPIIQAYLFLDLKPIIVEVDLKQALSRQNIRINMPSKFTVAISTEPGIMQNAAERLLGLSLSDIEDLARDIIFGQLRLAIALRDAEEIIADRSEFMESISLNVNSELQKIGLKFININIISISFG